MRKTVLAGGVLLAILISLFLLRLGNLKPKTASQPAADCVGVHSHCDVHVEFATDQAQREKGLSGRDSLGANNGMLFVFTTTAEQCMWMKDMKFSIDMVWLSERKTVTAIEKNVSPSTYPNSFCHDGKYVVELPAGSTERLALKKYQQFTFTSN